MKRRKIRELWTDFQRNEVFRFENLKELESKNLFGVIENHNYYKNNHSIFSTKVKNTSFKEKTEKKEKYLQPGQNFRMK